MIPRKMFPPLASLAFAGMTLFSLIAFFTSANKLAEVLRAIQIPICCAVVVAYLPDSLKGAFAEKPDGVQQLTLGIVCGWLAAIGIASWGLLFRLANQPQWMLNTDIINVFSALSCFGATLHITAPGALHGVPRRSAVILGVAIGIAVFVLLSLDFLHLNIGPMVNHLRPYLEDQRPLSFEPSKSWSRILDI